jgi:hypothetical protein
MRKCPLTRPHYPKKPIENNLYAPRGAINPKKNFTYESTLVADFHHSDAVGQNGHFFYFFSNSYTTDLNEAFEKAHYFLKKLITRNIGRKIG